MQKSFLLIAIIGAASTLQAQQLQCTTPSYLPPGPACDTGPQCEWRPPPAAPPHAPPHAPPQAPPQQPPQQSPPSGYYAAPPPSGPMQGPSRATEIEGAALRFPALELKLPSLRLPSCSRIHSNARMLIEAAHAPYVQQPQMALGSPIAIQQMPGPQQAPPQQSPPQQTPPQPPRMPPHAPPNCDAPRSPQQCDAAVLDLERQLRARDQKIEQLNQQMSRMAVTMERLTQVMDRLAVVSDESKNVAINQMSFSQEPIREPAMQTIHTGTAQSLRDPRADSRIIREPGVIRLSNYNEPSQGAAGEPRRLR